MQFKSTYLKLTAFYVLVVMLVSISFSVAIYKISSNEIKESLGKQSGIARYFLDGSDSMPNSFEELRIMQIEQSNARIRVNLVYFNLIILIISTLVSYFFARYTIRPIEKAYDAQNRFTADASHELRTPLTAMKSEIEVNLRDPNFDINQAKELFQSNLEEINKLESLSGALLKLARSNEESRPSFKNVSLQDVAEEAVAKCLPLAEKKAINLEIKVATAAKIEGDRQTLVELATIFIDNAIKYSPKSSTVVVSVLEEKEHSILSFKDNGVGIKASDLPHIFERFYRADHSRSKERINGYGLGLAIANSLVDLHHGAIVVKSTPGKGSEFSLKFRKA